VNSRLYPKVLLTVLLGCTLAVRAEAKDSIGAPVSVATNEYSIRVEASNAFMQDENKLRQEATDAANRFCQSQGKVFQLVEIKSKLPWFSTGYGWAKITFKALNPNDPILTTAAVAVAPAPGAAMAPAAPPPPQVITTDELYTQLLKLDDLRKKGILTEAEFEEEKKKVLSHTQ